MKSDMYGGERSCAGSLGGKLGSDEPSIKRTKSAAYSCSARSIYLSRRRPRPHPRAIHRQRSLASKHAHSPRGPDLAAYKETHDTQRLWEGSLPDTTGYILTIQASRGFETRDVLRLVCRQECSPRSPTHSGD
ncbi:hypothetical protein B0H12DRAFT_299467 [Mycena haematopus]|nr:hypothetical protein B0H12DRAFT_299467 [Mycena haematopus]